ncbi:cytosine permease [uncultured Cyclobacterium sp.]|uniref:purine-cytosine permease family protein n=1 Tax=uncultured Cyclobacterium sp. TaxID=453820 RepID=UPI0030ECDD19|tara:strand:+ start:23005 stop:24360 length:1356 start_codon:yes stop_codon:yes gene_type:complete
MKETTIENELERGDEVRSRLPASKRLGFWSNTFILWGLVLTVTSLLVGGLVGSQLAFKDAVIVIAMAGVFNSLVAILIGIIGARTGYTSAMIFRYSYGVKGVLLPNFIIAITTVIWFAVILNLTRDSFVGIIGVSTESSVLFYGITLLMAILFLIPAYKTMKWIAYVNYLAVPAIVFILIVTVWGALDAGGGLMAIIDKSPVASASSFVVFTAAAGGWLHANTVISDFTRFYKTGKQAALGLFLTYGVMMVFQYIGATLGALATGEWNIFLIMDQFGLLEISFLAIFLGSWSTAMAAIYFGANMMSTPPMPKYKTEEKNRKLVLLISWGIALFFAWYGPDQIFNFFLQFLSWVIGPIAMTVIIDYWLFPEKRGLYERADGSPDMVINPAAFLAWVVGFLIGYFSQEFFISLINGMLTTGVIYYAWMRIALNQGLTPETQLKKWFSSSKPEK